MNNKDLVNKLMALADELEGKEETEPKWEPKIGDMVRAWNNDVSHSIIGILRKIDGDSDLSYLVGETWFKHVAPAPKKIWEGWMATDKNNASYLYRGLPRKSCGLWWVATVSGKGIGENVNGQTWNGEPRKVVIYEEMGG